MNLPSTPRRRLSPEGPSPLPQKSREEKKGPVVSPVHTVIRQLASSAFSSLYLDDSLHPNELCQNGI
ncbi:hypothetical protein NQZ68_020463 [Dissostichus eleginoides]|nr:hypothetical protein NQZ68_020463 [Dissostichus eleginoides]